MQKSGLQPGLSPASRSPRTGLASRGQGQGVQVIVIVMIILAIIVIVIIIIIIGLACKQTNRQTNVVTERAPA